MKAQKKQNLSDAQCDTIVSNLMNNIKWGEWTKELKKRKKQIKKFSK